FFDPKAYTPENIYLDYESIALLARGGVKLIKAETGGKFIGCVNFPLPYGDGTVWFDSDSKLSRMKFNCRFFGACGMAPEAFIDAIIESQSVEFRSASFGRKFEPYFNEQF